MRLLLKILILSAFPLCVSGQIAREKSVMKEEILTITFCEMVKNPKKYFDKMIRLTAIFKQATESQYLSDDNCPLSHDNQIGIGYNNSDKSQLNQNNAFIRKIQSIEFGGKATVTIAGILRNASRRDFAWYQYRFDINLFENVSPSIEEYKGNLESGITYRAKVRPDKNFGIGFVIPYRLPFHHALQIEWTNLKDFSALNKFETKEIVFTVLSKEIKQISENRWNTVIRCKIIRDK